jgi:thiol-disulfide isomerase/thioredoxin
MNRFFHIAGYTYVAFALIVAHTALAPHEASFAGSVDDQAVVATPEEVVLDHQRLHQSDAGQVRPDKSNYTVEIWAAEWCGKCPAYKRRVVPTLLKLGYTVTNKDWDADAKDRPKNMTAVPTVCLYYKGTFLRMWTSPPVLAVDFYVNQRMSLKESTR